MLTPPDQSGDGSKLAYLDDPPAWRHRDPPVFDLLKDGADDDQRCVRRLETSGLLPGAVFFSEVLAEDALQRDAYFTRAVVALSGSDLLFFDPDTGLEVPSTRYGRKGSCRYLYWREVENVARTGASAVIFQHWKRENRQILLARLTGAFRSRVPQAAVLSIDSPFVVFLIACQPTHRERFAVALRLLHDRWDGDLEIK